MTSPVKILTFTPVWQRQEIFEICLQGIKRLMKYDPKRFQITPFFVVSESWAAQLLNKHKFAYIYHQNQPLGDKKNAGIRYAINNFEFDYILEIGSDDLITNEWLEVAEPHLLAGVKQFHPCNVYFADIRNGHVGEWTTDKILGLGRFIHRSAIEHVHRNFDLWEPIGRRGMDTFSWRQMLKCGIGNNIINTSGRVLTLDIKSDININQMSAFAPTSKTLDEILAPFPEAPLIRKHIQSFNPSVPQ